MRLRNLRHDSRDLKDEPASNPGRKCVRSRQRSRRRETDGEVNGSQGGLEGVKVQWRGTTGGKVRWVDSEDVRFDGCSPLPCRARQVLTARPVPGPLLGHDGEEGRGVGISKERDKGEHIIYDCNEYLRYRRRQRPSTFVTHQSSPRTFYDSRNLKSLSEFRIIFDSGTY